MITQLYPQLEGIAAERFLALAKQLENWQKCRVDKDLEQLCEIEIAWARNHPHLNGSREMYEATARVIIDLARLSWKIQQTGYNLELHSPSFSPKHLTGPESINQYKETVRQELRPLRESQLNDPSVRKFIERLEKPQSNSKRKSILNLIADGNELYNRISPAIKEQNKERSKILELAIKPYLQLVPGEGEKQIKDKFTGINLNEIWRYFRYTWTIPQLPIPGRQLLYLIRDGSHPYHAIIGIAALSNCAMQMKNRDYFIGWTYNSFYERVKNVINCSDPENLLQELFDLLENNISKSLENIEIQGLIEHSEIENPTLENIARLRRHSEKFAQLRQEALKLVLTDINVPFTIQELEFIDNPLPPVSEEVIDLDSSRVSNQNLNRARKMLIAKKRAAELSRLLQARYYLKKYKNDFLLPSNSLSVCNNQEFRVAVTTALFASKSEHIGTNMLEITTCGAIKPYNLLLGGKLTALLMLSPQISADYHQRYGNKPSIIGSQLKNQPLQRDTSLVYLGTTSLYAHGNSQYDRLKLPRGVIASNQPEIKFELIGYTSGFGTVQFSTETARAIEKILEMKLGYQNVNSIFGEGPSPRLRKLTAGLKEIGFNPEILMRHNQHRLIYSISLCENARNFLRGEGVPLPDYLTKSENYLDSTSRIIAYWRERWLSSRLNHTPTLDQLEYTSPWALSEDLPIKSNPKIEVKNATSIANAENLPGDPNIKNDLEFWRSLASAGPSVCSDELTEEDLKRLHIHQVQLENFIIQKVSDGFSIVLTGNAGDGKTHLIKQLEQKLKEKGAIVQPDATAAMRHGDISYILNEWQQAIAQKRPYCLAANEYPLYEIRTKGKNVNPTLNSILTEVDRQCKQRLAFGPVQKDEDAQDKVIVIDLSLRNPLNTSFVGSLIDCLLNNNSIKKFALSNMDPDFSRNYKHLSNKIVKDRLIALYKRLAERGLRSSIRELWIINTRLLYGNGITINTAVGSPISWYSERLFEPDNRFVLSQYLRQYCDPSRFSHPQWDVILEHSSATKADDWFIDKKEPLYDLRENGHSRFDAMKRIFYFEHTKGLEVFKLEDDAAQDFHQLINKAGQADDMTLKDIIEAINLAYCPQFNGIRDALFLWIGHRYHEKPTRSYIANQRIGYDHFALLIPRLPSRISDSISYLPDHILLRYEQDKQIASLRIDFSLYNTLQKLRKGLPRHLVPERDINRLDVFLEQLRAMGIGQQREYITFNAAHRSLCKIRLSHNFEKYEEVNING